MKNTIIIILSSLLLGTAHKAHAQYQHMPNAEVLNAASSNTAKAVADANVYNEFHKAFPGITNESWTRTLSGDYCVRFSTKEISNWVFVDKKGAIHSQVRFYSERSLPANIRKEVKSAYYDYAIKNVKEVSINQTTAFFVTIEDESSWKVIRLTDEGMDVWEEHVKG